MESCRKAPTKIGLGRAAGQPLSTGLEGGMLKGKGTAEHLASQSCERTKEGRKEVVYDGGNPRIVPVELRHEGPLEFEKKKRNQRWNVWQS